MSPFKGVRPGDVIYVVTKAENGYAIAKKVTDQGVEIEPIGGAWQKSRVARPPVKAHEIKHRWKKVGK